MWDFLPGGDVALLAGEDGNFIVAPHAFAQSVAGDGGGDGARHWNPTSHLQQITPLGELVTKHETACTGDPTNYNALSHECRVDATSVRRDVLTTRALVKHFPGTACDFLPVAHANHTTSATYDYWFGSELVRWNRVDNVIEPLYDLCVGFRARAPRRAIVSGR